MGNTFKATYNNGIQRYLTASLLSVSCVPETLYNVFIPFNLYENFDCLHYPTQKQGNRSLRKLTRWWQARKPIKSQTFHQGLTGLQTHALSNCLLKETLCYIIP